VTNPLRLPSSLARRAAVALGLGAVIASTAGAIASCSLANIGHDDCEGDAECAGAFGAGSRCEEGYCTAPQSVVPSLDRRCVILGPEDGDAYVYGMVLPRTNKDGSPHKWGPFWEQSVHLAVDQLNPPVRSGIRGKPMRILSCNSSGDTKQAAELATHLMGLGVHAIISDGSGETLAIAALTVPAGVFLLAGASTSPEVTTIADTSPEGNVGLVWRTTPSDVFQGKVLAAELSDVPVGTPLPNIAVFERDDPYGQGLYAAFNVNFDGTATPLIFPPVTSDSAPAALTAAFEGAVASGADTALVIGFPDDVTAILNGADAYPALDGIRWFFTQGGKFPGLFDIATPQKIQGARGTSPAFAEKGSTCYTWFKPQYEQRYETISETVVDLTNMFDAAMVLAIATHWATEPGRTLDGTNLALALTHMSKVGAASVSLDPPNFGKAAQELSAGRDIDISGCSGSLDFDNATGEAPANIEVWEVVGETFVTQKTVAP
jgi:branched-chain amino acid transport system substrate-binding protein